MSKATKSSAQGTNQVFLPEELNPSSQEELSSSDQEPDPEVSFQPRRQPQPVPSMFMPYNEALKYTELLMVGFIIGFLKWFLKCENILECNH